jgi:hypothetical protein
MLIRDGHHAPARATTSPAPTPNYHDSPLPSPTKMPSCDACRNPCPFFSGPVQESMCQGRSPYPRGQNPREQDLTDRRLFDQNLPNHNTLQTARSPSSAAWVRGRCQKLDPSISILAQRHRSRRPEWLYLRRRGPRQSPRGTRRGPGHQTCRGHTACPPRNPGRGRCG